MYNLPGIGRYLKFLEKEWRPMNNILGIRIKTYEGFWVQKRKTQVDLKVFVPSVRALLRNRLLNLLQVSLSPLRTSLSKKEPKGCMNLFVGSKRERLLRPLGGSACQKYGFCTLNSQLTKKRENDTFLKKNRSWVWRPKRNQTPKGRIVPNTRKVVVKACKL